MKEKNNKVENTSNLSMLNEKVSILKLFWFVIKIYWKDNKLRFLGIVVLIFLSVSFVFVNSWAFAQMINNVVSPERSWKIILPYFVILISVDFLPSLFGYWEESLRSYLEKILSIELEDKINQKLSRLDIATIEDPDFQNHFSIVKTRSLTAFTSVGSWFYALIRQFIKLGISIGVLLSISRTSVIVLLACTLPVYFFEAVRSKKLFKLFEGQTENNRKLSFKMGAFGNKYSLSELKIFNSFSFFRDKIKTIRISQLKDNEDYDLKTFKIHAISSILPDIGVAYVFIGVVNSILKGALKVGSLTFVWSTLFQFQSGLTSTLRSFGRLKENGAFASKAVRLLELKPRINENKNGIVLDWKNPPIIEFRNVSFSYDLNDRIILKNINLVIEPGNEIAIVGLNGAGKTTLIKLLTRVYDPTEGEILVNGINLKDCNLFSWQKTVSIMFQDYTIYYDESIKTNIILSEGEYNKELVNKSIRDSMVLDFANKYEKGIEQMIGNEFRGGVELSKGQRQKIALARNLYHDRSVMILDEPTSAIDAISEDHIFKAIRENYKNKTRIIISHKFSNVRSADKIILLADGQILEEGSHEELMSKKGKYKELFELQADGYK